MKGGEIKLFMFAFLDALMDGFLFNTAGIDYSSMFGEVSSTVLDGVSAIAPIAITIFGSILAISIGMKVFGKISKRG